MSDPIVVSEIQISPVKPSNGLCGFASCAINNAFYVGSIAIYTALNSPLGYRLVFPTKKLISGKQVPVFYPYKKNVEEAVTRAVVGKYVELMENFHHIE